MKVKYSLVARFFMRRFRVRRLAAFRELFPPESCRTIIDVGGNPDIWNALKYPAAVTLLNSDARELHSSNGYRAVVGDGRDLQFPYNSFDLAFSNSVIEHVGGWHDMQRFAAELRRVGQSYYCQTPNKWFPVEPHLGTLFIHWWPWLLNHYFVVRYFTLWGLMNKPKREAVKNSLAEIRLLTKRELRALFPDSTIVTERFCGLPKSYAAIYLPI